MKYLLILIVYCSVISNKTLAQITSPLDFNLEVAGNFCELRGSHFHTGVDLKTKGLENQNVYSVADGYVSRIGIFPNGYGKVLYITHPELGITTVYAHLNSFEPKIAEFALKAQYHLKSNTLDTILAPGILPVFKRSLIGLSGNTGSSQAPHLHFEIRDTESEITLNPEAFLKIKDNMKPQGDYILFYSKELGETKLINKIPIKLNHTIEIPNKYKKIGLGISAKDFYTDQNNVMGLYKISLYKDLKPLYSLRFDSMSFDHQAQIKAHSETEYPDTKNAYKLFLESCGENLFYNQHNGILQPEEHSVENLSIKLEDFSGNISIIPIRIVTKKYGKPDFWSSEYNCYLGCHEDLEIQNSTMKFFLPKKSLVSDRPLTYSYELPNLPYTISKIKLMTEHTATMKPYQINFLLKENELKLKDKLFLQTNEGPKKRTYLGQVINGEYVLNNVKTFGNLWLRVDTFGPEIKWLDPVKYGNQLLKIRYSVDDAESGIEDFKFYIDDVWHPVYYDQKSKSVFYDIDKFYTPSLKQIKIKAIDKVGNERVKVNELTY